MKSISQKDIDGTYHGPERRSTLALVNQWLGHTRNRVLLYVPSDLPL